MAETDQLRERADQRYEEALREIGARDPRDFYRERLKGLRAQDPEGFRRALGYFNERLIPAVAAEGSDPLGEWLEYGRLLAGLCVPGRTVQIDTSGRSRDYSPPAPVDALVLHLPENPGQAALLVGIPARLSPAQKAAHDLLVRQHQGS